MKKRAAVLLACLAFAGTGFALWQVRRIAAEALALETERLRLAQLERTLALHQQAARAAATVPTPTAPDPATAAISAEAEARETEMKLWYARLRRLRESFAIQPGQSIPELALLTDLDWLNLARSCDPNASDDALRTLRATARNEATFRAIAQFAKALRGYLKTSQQQLPTDLAQLQPYFEKPLDPAILARYELLASGTFPVRGPGARLIGSRTAVDEIYDTQHTVSGGGGTMSYSASLDFIHRALAAARTAYTAQNGAQPPDGNNQDKLIPYIADREARIILQAMADYRAQNGRDASGVRPLLPLIHDPAALAKIEKMLLAETHRASSRLR